MSAASSSSASAAAAASSASAAAAAAPSSRAQPLVDDTEDERKESDTNMSDAKMEPVKGLDDGDANDDLKLKSQEGEVFRTYCAHMLLNKSTSPPPKASLILFCCACCSFHRHRV